MSEAKDPNAEFLARYQKKRRRGIRRVQKWLDRLGWRVAKLLYTPLAARMRRQGRCFLVITNPNRIGHLAVEQDWYFRKVALGELPRRRPMLILPKGRAANDALLAHWARHVEVVESPLRRRLLRPYMEFPDLVVDLAPSAAGVTEPADYPGLLARWGDRPPIISLTQEERAAGRATLERMGLPPDAWFVCVHAREGGYSPKDEFMHAHRNSDIATCVEAMEAIVARGGWAIRVGDPTMTPLEERPGIVDYANSPHRSPEMDMFLCAETRLFLGNTSGLCMVATAFGRPTLLVNMTPHGAGLGMAPGDVAVPKLLRGPDGQLLPFPEIFAGDASHLRFAELFRERGLEVVDNTPEEIREAVEEVLDRQEGRFEETEADRARQRAYRALFRPVHYCSLSAASISTTFLRRHAALLETAPLDIATPEIAPPDSPQAAPEGGPALRRGPSAAI